MTDSLTSKDAFAVLAEVAKITRELAAREQAAAARLAACTAQNETAVALQTKNLATLACYTAVHAKMLLTFACGAMAWLPVSGEEPRDG